MITKKILCTAVLLGVAFSSAITFAEPIVELAAPRIQTQKVISDSGAPLKPKVQENQPSAKNKAANISKDGKPVKQTCKKIRKHVRKKPAPIVVDYNKISKLIEYGYYDYADRILQGAIDRNSKDIKAQALSVISLAKQVKLDPAQQELNVLLKKYPDNSNLHYAQGIVDYQRTASSNMLYRNNSPKLLNDSMTEFKKAIDLDKNNARAYNAAGVISIKLGNDKDAVAYFKKALDVDKTYSLAIDNLGTLDFAAGKLKDAEKKFKDSLTYNTQNTTAMYHLAQIAVQNKDYATALSYLNNALAINSNSPAIYNLMGKAYTAQGNEAAAINAFKQSIVVKPEFTLSYLDLANIYERRGDSEFAIEQLKTVLAIEPDYYDAKLKLADISLESGKYKQAVDVYSELVGIDGYNESALKGLGSAYYGMAQVASNKALLGSNKDLFTAFDCINKAIAANPQDLELYLAKLRLAKLTNQPEQSKIALNKIIQSPAKDLSSLIAKGEAYSTINDYQNAQIAFDSAMKLSTNTDTDLYLSEILIYSKQYDNAEKVIQKILKNDAKNQEALNGLDYIQKSKKYADNYFKSAKSFLKSGNQASAKEYFTRSLALNPKNPQANLLLAELCEKQKDYPTALKNYKAYLGLEPYASDAKKVARKIQNLEDKL